MIYMDDREPIAIQKMAKEYLDNVEVTHLEVGDFVYRDTVIEAKRKNDFITSLNDGRLHNQIVHMKRNFKNSFVIIVGSERQLFDDDYSSLTPHRYNLFQVECACDPDIQHIRVANNEEFFRTVRNIFKHADGPSCKFNELKKVAHRTDDRYVGIIMAGVEGIGPAKAREILKHFKVWELFEVTEKDLVNSCKGIGPIQAKKIKEIFNK